MAPTGPLLELRAVTKRYNPPDGGDALVVLDSISLAIARGESIAVVGPSGSGKSTLLHIMGTLDRPTSGQVLFDGVDLSSLGDKETASIRNLKLGFVFQAHYLLPQCTILENVLVPTLAGHRTGAGPGAAAGNASSSKPEDVEARARRLLRRVGLADRVGHRPGQLSGGERQRAAVVRALINSPELLLADEPTGSLDQRSAHELGRLLTELNREEQVTLVVVTHALDLAGQMNRVLALKDGRLEPAPA